MAKAQGISVLVESRGINPENHISPLLADRLKRDGIDPLSQPLQRFTPDDAKAADIVIAFDEAADAPGLKDARRWRVASWNTQYDDARSDTLENETKLLQELRAQSCGFSREPGARP